MVIIVSLVVALALIGLCARTWMEFGQRSQQLKSEVAHNKALVAEHTDMLESMRTKIDRVKRETELLLKQRGMTETDVMEQREQVTQMEERLERAKPSARRIDMGKKDELFE